MKRRALTIMLVGLALGVVDGILKSWALKNLPTQGDSLHPVLDLLLHKNYGVAFNTPIPLPITAAITLCILVLLFQLTIRTWQKNPMQSAASVLMIIGAVGNLGDRLIHGFTTDYLLLFGRSVVNVSDILIAAGLLILFRYSKSIAPRK